MHVPFCAISVPPWIKADFRNRFLHQKVPCSLSTQTVTGMHSLLRICFYISTILFHCYQKVEYSLQPWQESMHMSSEMHMQCSGLVPPLTSFHAYSPLCSVFVWCITYFTCSLYVLQFSGLGDSVSPVVDLKVLTAYYSGQDLWLIQSRVTCYWSGAGNITLFYYMIM
jgi:hypothetical protein